MPTSATRMPVPAVVDARVVRALVGLRVVFAAMRLVVPE
jgi:hypothetical protein